MQTGKFIRLISAILLLTLASAPGRTMPEEMKADNMQASRNSVAVSQTISVAPDSVLVVLQYENTSAQAVLIMEGVFGIAPKGRPPGVYRLSEAEFSLSTDGKPVAYLGQVANRGAFTRDYFVSFAPGERSVRSFQIAKDFKFLPGLHEYTLVHRHLQYDEANGKITEHRSAPVNFSYAP